MNWNAIFEICDTICEFVSAVLFGIGVGVLAALAVIASEVYMTHVIRF